MKTARVPARSLISENRLDIGARIPLAEAFSAGWPLQWGMSLYESFLFSAAQSRDFGESWKNGVGDLTASYLGLLSSIQHNGFDVNRELLPVAANHLLGGAHRVAAQIVSDGYVQVIESSQAKERWNYDDLLQTGLSEDLANAMVMALVRYASGMRCLAIFTDGEQIPGHWRKELTKLSVFRPTLTIALSAVGRRRIFQCFYGMHTWWDDTLTEKFDFERFGDSSNPHVHIVIFDQLLNGSVDEIKQRLRESRLPGQTERVVHGSDSLDETVFALQTLLFSTGRHFVNTAPVNSERNLLNETQQLRSDNALAAGEPICLGGSAALEAYGIRQARDLDVLTMPGIQLKARASTIAPFGEAPMTADRLILDPRLNVRFGSLTFLSLPALVMLKAGRAEEKDIEDIKLVINSPSSSIPVYLDMGAGRAARRYRSRLRVKAVVREWIDLLPAPVTRTLLELYRRMKAG